MNGSTHLPEASRTHGAAMAAESREVRIDLRDHVVRRRSALKHAMSNLESALARPVGRHADRWLEQTGRVLEDLCIALDHHIQANVGPESFHAQVLEAEPQLAPRVQRLERDHDRLRTVVGEIREQVQHGIATRAGEEAAREVRMVGSDLLLLLVHHRQRGADLAWESVNLDIGGGD